MERTARRRVALTPRLRAGDELVMDHLAVHKLRAVAEAVECSGATVRFLPPYSPDLNPIESMIAKVKTGLRSAKARTSRALERALSVVMRSVTAADARGYFMHCGYR